VRSRIGKLGLRVLCIFASPFTDFAAIPSPQVIDPLLDDLKERKWDGVIVGFGVRGDDSYEGPFILKVNLDFAVARTRK